MQQRECSTFKVTLAIASNRSLLAVFESGKAEGRGTGFWDLLLSCSSSIFASNEGRRGQTFTRKTWPVLSVDQAFHFQVL